MCLVETGTRLLVSAVIGGAIGVAGERDESHLARRLLGLLGPGMLLADRAYDSASLLAEIDTTGAQVLIRGAHRQLCQVAQRRRAAEQSGVAGRRDRRAPGQMRRASDW